MTRPPLKRTLLSLAGLLLLLGAGGFGLVVYKDQRWVQTPPYTPPAGATLQTLVVHYSRSGNTLGAAREVARHFGARMVGIEAPAYPRTLAGQRKAGADAAAKLTRTKISHPPVQPGRYRLVFLCAPTWWYRPAVPLWTFVEDHDFGGKPVFLLLTGNSRYKQKLVDRFAALVRRHNGRFIGHLFVRRGRVLWQKTPAEVAAEVRSALRARADLWPISAR